MAAEANALLDLIGKAANFAEQISSRWYKASDALNSFPSKLTTVKQRSDNWTSLLKRYGMSADEFIKPVLEQASCLLVDEEVRLQNLQSNCCLRMWQKLLFPDSMTASLDNIIATFDKLPQLMLEKETIRRLLEKGDGKVALLPFESDPKYVEFHSTILKVRRALESETTGHVVILHGGPGQGKTSMARHLALLYQNAIVNPHASVPEETLPASTMFIDGVVFLSCGPEKESKDLLVELWQKLGYELPSSTAEAKQDQDGSGGPQPGPQQSFISESFLYGELTTRLSSQKVLVVLDDVRESTRLEKVLIRGVKYLITTLNQQVWPDAACEKVPIGTPTPEEAFLILTNYVYGRPTHVPAELQDEINDIIEKCDCNPLVLTNVATNVSTGSFDLEEWRSTRKYLNDLIRLDQDVRVEAVLFRRTYSKTIRASTTMALNSFSKEERVLLLLATLCETQLIPEVVLKIFFKKIRASLAKFLKHIERLESNNFIQIQRTKVPWSSVPERSWSLHQLRQNAIDSIEEEEVKSMFDTLLNYKTHKNIVLALLVLYGQPRWRDEAANALGIQVTSDLALAPLKPFVSLLKLDGEEWEEKSSLLVEQVIQEYLHSGELDDVSLSMLLTMEETCSSTCDALVKMAALKTSQIFSQGYPKTLDALLNLVGSVHNSASSIPERSVWLLVDEISLQWMGTAMEIGSIPTVLQRLVALLADDVNRSTQYRALQALDCLAWQVFEKKINFGLIPHAIERLVALLVDPTMQEIAARALVHIAGGVTENKTKIVSCPGAIENLVALLAKDDDAHTQWHAASTLWNLSSRPEISKKIGSFSGAIERLVGLLAKDVRPFTRRSVVGTLADLSCKVEENRIEVQKALQQAPSIVENVILIASGEDDEADLQYWAAKLYEVTLGTDECKMRSYQSSKAYLGEGDARVYAGDYEGALGAYDNGLAISSKWTPLLFSRRCFVKASLGDFEGALNDANTYIEVGENKQLGLQERGILKRMAGDLNGALEDLSEALTLVTDDYESLKHRGFVRFLLSDEDGARADAESAMRTSTDGGLLKFELERIAYLGTSSVEYLGYKLT